MASGRYKPYLIDQLDQIRALIAPARQEIIDAMETSGPTTVAAIGAMLGRAPDSLYHHIRVLLNVGLIKQVETRISGRTRQAVYELSGSSMEIHYNLQDSQVRDSLIDLSRSMTRIAQRDFSRAARRGDAIVEGARRNLRSARMVRALDDGQLEEINRLYARIVEIMRTDGRGDREQRPYAVTFLVAPLERKRQSAGQ
jgi:DNA-binding transcriptional ArsR family regulator